MRVKSMTRFYVVFFLLCVNCCRSETEKFNFETHSIFYGLALTAASREDPRNICEEQLAAVENGVRRYDRWAIKLMDASGIPDTGLYWGNTFWLGSQSQCAASASMKQIAVSPEVGPVTMETPETIPPFPVDYYAAYFHHNSTMQVFMHWRTEMMVTIGLCIPASCQESEVGNLLQEYFDSNVLYHQALYNMSLRLESVKKNANNYSWVYSTKIIVAFGFIAIFAIMCFLGTAFDPVNQPSSVTDFSHNSDNLKDLNHENEKYSDGFSNNKDKVANQLIERKDTTISFFGKMLHCFNLSVNAKEILSTDTKAGTLIPLHGLRFFTSFYVLMAHSVVFTTDHVNNRIALYYTSDTLNVQAFVNAHFFVDTFFTLGGFLTAYVFFKTNKKSNSKLISNVISLFTRTMKRFFRLTPVYMTALCITFITSTWRHHTSSYWTMDYCNVNCGNYWWRNILYINNLFPRDEICMIWSWYLSCDMQFFVITMAILLLSTVNFKLASRILVSTFVGSCLYTACAVYYLNYKPLLDVSYETFQFIYASPLIRIAPYLVGVAAGYILHVNKGKLTLNKTTTWFLWAVGITLNLGILFGLLDRNISLPFSMVYMSFSRALWGVGIAWVILSCVTHNGGITEKVLSFKCWIPLSNISYCAYLMNPIIIYFFTSLNEKSWEIQMSSALSLGLSYTTFSYIFGFILALMVELPSMQLVKLFTESNKNMHKEKDVMNEKNNTHVEKSEKLHKT